MFYSELSDVYEELEKTTKRLNKTFIISEFLRKLKKEELRESIYLLQGIVFPRWDERKIGMSSRLILKTISLAAGTSVEKVEKLWVEKGDLGIVAEMLIDKKKQTTLTSNKLTIEKVFSNLQKLASLEGEGTVSRKVNLVAELLTSASAKEARYITRTVLNELRVGVAAGTLRDSLVWAFYPKVVGIFFRCEKCKTINPSTKKCLNCGAVLNNKFKEEIEKEFKNCLKVDSLKEVKLDYDYIIAENEKLAREIYNSFIDKAQKYYDVTNDFSQVAIAIKEKKDVKAKIVLGKPINPMLAIRVGDIKDGLKALGKPLFCDYKVDGFRLQIHKDKDKFWLYTRRLESMNKQFKELIPIIKKQVNGNSFILDAEIIGYDKKIGSYLPFQMISQRIKRKYDIDKIARDIPVEINLFDILYLDGKSLMDLPQEERRKILEKIVKPIKHKIVLIPKLISSNEKEIEKFYNKALSKGLEGVMLKSLYKRYTPGRKVDGWMKLKPNLEPLDLVIVGATYGEGKRANVLSSFNLACFEKGKFLECGMMGTGIKEKSEEGVSFTELTKLLKKYIVKKNGKSVDIKPEIVVEVVYEEIQKSPTYDSGYALRFPRLHRLRYDKKAKQANDLTDLKRIYGQQRGRSKNNY